MQALLAKTSERFPQFQEHARFLSREDNGLSRFGGLVRSTFARSSASAPANGSAAIFSDVSDESELSRAEFAEMLKTIDLGLRALPATAQVCAAAMCFLVRQ